MFTKITTPLFCKDDNRLAAGIHVEYRIFGLLVYTKIRYTPYHYGVREWIGGNDLNA